MGEDLKVFSLYVSLTTYQPDVPNVSNRGSRSINDNGIWENRFEAAFSNLLDISFFLL